MGRDEDALKNSATMDLSDLLVSYGFSPKEAIQVSTNFWNKHKAKLKSAGAW